MSGSLSLSCPPCEFLYAPLYTVYIELLSCILWRKIIQMPSCTQHISSSVLFSHGVQYKKQLKECRPCTFEHALCKVLAALTRAGKAGIVGEVRAACDHISCCASSSWSSSSSCYSKGGITGTAGIQVMKHADVKALSVRAASKAGAGDAADKA
jgi:hypothetical protein